jgi:eukaryotic-like serine/threonine-protein kinase
MIEKEDNLDTITQLGEYDDTLSFSRASKQDAEAVDLDEINKLLDLDVEDKSINRYTHIKTIGLGGVGAVLSAYEPELNREVAIKILRPDFRNKADSLKRFVREARATAHIEHPNIVPVHQLGVFSDNGVFFSMKKVEGRNLRSVIRKLSEGNQDFLKKYTLRQLLQIFVSIGNGVAYAHSKGVIHRDLKPANIMLGDYGEVMVMDWGLVKYHAEKDDSREEWHVDLDPDFSTVGHGDAMSTIQGSVSGTPAYMAPEQAGGHNEEVDEQTDIYSLGATLYSMLTWETAPFESPMTTNQVLNSVVNGTFKRPRKRAPKRKISRELEAVCLKAMSRKKNERYKSAEKMVRDIKDYLEGYSVSAYRASWARRFFKTIRRRPLIPSATIVAIFTFLGVLGILHYENKSRVSNLKNFAEYSIGQGDNYYLNALKAYQKLQEEHKKPADETSYGNINNLFAEFNRYKLEFNSNYSVAAQFLFQAEDLGGRSPGINKELLKVLKQQLNFSLITGNYEETRGLVKQLRLRRHSVFGEIIGSDNKIYEQIKMIIRDQGMIKVNSTPDGVYVFYQNFNDEGTAKTEKNKMFLGKTPFEAKVPTGSYLLLPDGKNMGKIKYPVQVLCGQINSVRISVPANIPKGMSYVPEGYFYAGNRKDLSQMQKIFLPSYFINSDEVTLGEYLEFWKSLKSSADKKHYQAHYLFSNGDFEYLPIWDESGKLRKGFKKNMPVVGITGKAAEAYCAWLSKKLGSPVRLPTNLEWEKAARGVDGRMFTWGNTHDEDAALCWDNKAAKEKYPIAAPVCSFPKDVSIYGVKDLIGNVHEFTTEKVNSSNVFVIKGGSLQSRLLFSHCGYSTHSSGEGENDLGFRYLMPIRKKD